MSKPETITIDDVKYVRADATYTKPTGSVTIVVLQRGWVGVGYLSQNPDNTDELILDRAATIRVWGTTKGLGEIASGGPTSKTVLDKTPQIKFYKLTSIMTLPCVEEKWQSVL